MNPKFKSENYNQMGGLNNKFSPYMLTPLEFLNLSNFDFQTPGALTQRWGSTQYIGQTFPGPVSSLYEFGRLEGLSYIIAGYSGGIFYGATTGQYQGLSLSFSVTFFWGGGFNQSLSPTFGYGYSTIFNMNPFDLGNISGSTGLFVQNPSIPLFGNAAQELPYQGATLTYAGQLQSDNTLSMAVLDDYLFAADGNKFFKFDGITTRFVSLPAPIFGTVNGGTLAGSAFQGSTATNLIGATLLGVGVSNCSYGFWGSFVNDRGFESQIWPMCAINAQASASTFGGSFIQAQVCVEVPPNYGIQSINVYSYVNSSSMSVGSTAFWNLGYGFFNNMSLNGSSLSSGMSLTSHFGVSFYIFSVGTSSGGQTSLAANIGGLPDPIINNYSPLGITYVSQGFTGVGFGPQCIGAINITPYFPRYLEVYQNRLFLSGFSMTPSTVWFSDVAEPEGYQPDFNFEVRTNDADNVTCMKAYSTRLYIFKKNTFHVLTGDNPNNFFLQQVSDQYGCVNNRCCITFGNEMAFLDRKGVILFNGANLSVLSIKIQNYFDRMNYTQALVTACAVHDKIRNQLLFAIPIDGSSTNNITLVYDYVVQAWTTHAGYSPTVFMMAQGYNITKYPMWGDKQGRINWSGPSMMGDNGAGITTSFKTRFIHDAGDSVQKQFRRLYMNNAPLSSTLACPIHFYQDYGSSQVLSTTMVIGPFQTRIDFGISAKSMAFDFSAVATVAPLQINGFTVEQRMQRRV